MVNIFTYLDNYIKNNQTNPQYGSIGSNNIRQFLSTQEYEQYEQIKQSDKNRLLKFS